MGQQRQVAVLEATARELNDYLTVVLGCCDEIITCLKPGHPLLTDVAELVEAAGKVRVIAAALLEHAKERGANAASVSLENLLKPSN
jgi:hypothetical protein